jgi:hypothetical protein
MINKVENMWKEMVVAKFKTLSRHLPAGTEEDHGEPLSLQPVSELNPRPPENEAEVRSQHYNAR